MITIITAVLFNEINEMELATVFDKYLITVIQFTIRAQRGRGTQ